jgi:hypothetical protein
MEFIKTFDGFEILGESRTEQQKYQIAIDTPDGLFIFNKRYDSIEDACMAIKESSFK